MGRIICHLCSGRGVALETLWPGLASYYAAAAGSSQLGGLGYDCTLVGRSLYNPYTYGCNSIESGHGRKIPSSQSYLKAK